MDDPSFICTMGVRLRLSLIRPICIQSISNLYRGILCISSFLRGNEILILVRVLVCSQHPPIIISTGNSSSSYSTKRTTANAITHCETGFATTATNRVDRVFS